MKTNSKNQIEQLAIVRWKTNRICHQCQPNYISSHQTIRSILTRGLIDAKITNEINITHQMYQLDTNNHQAITAIPKKLISQIKAVKSSKLKDSPLHRWVGSRYRDLSPLFMKTLWKGSRELVQIPVRKPPHRKLSISAEKLHRALKWNGTQQSQQKKFEQKINKNKIKTKLKNISKKPKQIQFLSSNINYK